jgi:hypothetical protein
MAKAFTVIDLSKPHEVVPRDALAYWFVISAIVGVMISSALLSLLPLLLGFGAEWYFYAGLAILFCAAFGFFVKGAFGDYERDYITGNYLPIVAFALLSWSIFNLVLGNLLHIAPVVIYTWYLWCVGGWGGGPSRHRSVKHFYVELPRVSTLHRWRPRHRKRHQIDARTRRWSVADRKEFAQFPQRYAQENVNSIFRRYLLPVAYPGRSAAASEIFRGGLARGIGFGLLSQIVLGIPLSLSLLADYSLLNNIPSGGFYDAMDSIQLFAVVGLCSSYA